LIVVIGTHKKAHPWPELRLLAYFS